MVGFLNRNVVNCGKRCPVCRLATTVDKSCGLALHLKFPGDVVKWVFAFTSQLQTVHKSEVGSFSDV